MKPEMFLTTNAVSPTQVLLAAGIKHADTILWSDLESAQHDLKILLGNDEPYIQRNTVNWMLRDSAANVSYDFSSEVNMEEFRLIISVPNGTGDHVDVYARWHNGKSISAFTPMIGRGDGVSLAQLKKLHNACLLVGLPVKPLTDWVIELGEAINLGTSSLKKLNSATLDWLKAPLQSDDSLIRQAKYIVSTFAGLPTVADRKFEGIQFADEVAQSIRNQLWEVIFKLVVTAYGLSFEHSGNLWGITFAATDGALNRSWIYKFTTTDECNHHFGQLCANIVRTHRDLREALKDLL